MHILDSYYWKLSRHVDFLIKNQFVAVAAEHSHVLDSPAGTPVAQLRRSEYGVQRNSQAILQHVRDYSSKQATAQLQTWIRINFDQPSLHSAVYQKIKAENFEAKLPFFWV